MWSKAPIGQTMELLDKGESLAWQITSQFDKNIGCLCKATVLILFKKQPSLLLNRENI